MRIKSTLLFLLVFFLAVAACKETETPIADPVDKGPDVVDFPSATLSIQIPEGSNFDLEGSSILSYGLTSPVEKDGKSNVAINNGLSSPAFLFDKDENLILAGFISNQKMKISTETTAEYLLYLGLGIPFYERELTDLFLEQSHQIPGFNEWKNEVNNLFLSDPMMLENGSFNNGLKAKVSKIIEEGREKHDGRIIPEGRLKEDEGVAADVLVSGEKRSGLQFEQTGLNQFDITHYSRRRVHAFLYKYDYLDQSGNKHNLIPVFGENTKADMELSIPQVKGVRDLTGTIVDYLVGNISETASIKSETVRLPMDKNEQEINYLINVIGPGTPIAQGDRALTSLEKSKLTRLQMETLVLDFILPIIGDAISVGGMVNESSHSVLTDPLTWEELISMVLFHVDKMPGIKGKLDKGDFKGALGDYLTELLSESGKILFNDLAQIATKTIHRAAGQRFKVPEFKQLENKTGRFLKILAVTDLVLKGTDYVRIAYDILNSKNGEEWEIKLKEIKFNLVPNNFSISPVNDKKITAHIVSTIAADQVIEYEWKTTGKYGYLWDERGHKGNEFSSSINEAYYLCNAFKSDLNSSGNIDTVSVTAYLKKGQSRNKIGSTIAIVNVTKDKVFTVPFTRNCPIKESISGGKTLYTIGNAYDEAKFPEEENAATYTARTIRKDGSFSTPFRLTQISNGMVTFWSLDGTGLFGMSSYDKAKVEKEVARRLKIIEDRGNQGIEVTVTFKD